MNNKVRITYNDGKQIDVLKNTKIVDVVAKLPNSLQKKIVGAKIDNTIVNFDTKLKRDCTINFVDSNDLAGYKMYQAGLKFV